MNRDEIRTLLAYAAASTRDWAPTVVDVDVWLDLLHDLPYDEAQAALRQHAATSPYRPAPSDIRAAVKRARSDRLERTPDAVPDANPDDVPAYLDAVRDGRSRTAQGLQPRDMRQLPSAFPQLPPADPRPDLGPRNSPTYAGLPPVDDLARLEQARQEVAARGVIPIPEQPERDS